MPLTKDVRVDLRFRNNLILRRMEELGIRNVAELCRKMGTDNQGEVGLVIAMRKSPLLFNPDHPDRMQWRVTVERMAQALECSPEDLFSPEQLERELETNRKYIEISINEIPMLPKMIERMSLPPSQEETVLRQELRKGLRGVLETKYFTEKERRVIQMRFGLDGEEMTCEKIGKVLGVSGGRVQQIETMALKKLRHPRHVRVLEQFLAG